MQQSKVMSWYKNHKYFEKLPLEIKKLSDNQTSIRQYIRINVVVRLNQKTSSNVLPLHQRVI